MRSKYIYFIMFTIMGILMVPQHLFAYVGPGSGLSAIGAFFALIFAIFVGILGFLWYPIKRLFRRKNAEPEQLEEKE